MLVNTSGPEGSTLSSKLFISVTATTPYGQRRTPKEEPVWLYGNVPFVESGN